MKRVLGLTLIVGLAVAGTLLAQQESSGHKKTDPTTITLYQEGKAVKTWKVVEAGGVSRENGEIRFTDAETGRLTYICGNATAVIDWQQH